MKKETFEAICPTCGKNNEVMIKVREESFGYWEEIHCAWCGLLIDEVRCAGTPQAKVIGEPPENEKENTHE